jgi:predicted nucleotidyltransferase
MSAYLDLKEEFERLFGREVDLVTKGTIRNPFRRRSIERDLTVLYAAESG